MLVTVAVLSRASRVLQGCTIVLAGVSPTVLFESRRLFSLPTWVATAGWGSSNGTTVFLLAVSVLALLGRPSRSLILRVAVLAAAGFALVFWLTASWGDPFGQSLWSFSGQAAGGAPGTWQRVWNGGEDLSTLPRTPAQIASYARTEWLQAHPLRLKILPTVVVAGALLVTATLSARRRYALALALLLLALPFAAALVTCAAAGEGVWFQ